MELKKWEEYTKEEQKEFLNDWWHYYGKVIYTLEEWEQFNKLIDKDSDKILEMAIAGYSKGITSEPLIFAMRENKIEELFKTFPNLKEIKDEKFKEAHKVLKNSLILELVTTYKQTVEIIPCLKHKKKSKTK